MSTARTPPRARTAISTVALGTCVMIGLCGCSQSHNSTDPSDSRPRLNYAEVVERWDSASQLSGAQAEAAKFVAETEELSRQLELSSSFRPDLIREHDARVIYKYGKGGRAVDMKIDHETRATFATGGELFRAVGVDPVPYGYKVTLCEFDTPGVYSFEPNENNRILDPYRTMLRVSAVIEDVVSNTTAPSAADPKDAHPLSSPRPLVTHMSKTVENNVHPIPMCDPFTPNPFIQTPPPPLPTPRPQK